MEALFADYLRGEDMLFKHARGISDRSGKEFHIYHEIILFLGGDAEFITEDLHIQLKEPTLIVIPGQTYHQMVIHGEQEQYYRCVLQFSDSAVPAALVETSLQKVRAVGADREIRYLFDKLIRAAKADRAHTQQVLRSVLVLLLDALAAPGDMTEVTHHQNETVRMAVDYINRHLFRPLTVRAVAQACNLSESSLSHIFKKEMYISVHKFIVKKRLIAAYHKISAGEAATVAAEECGFRDYSGFYKQYKKAFGVPPSQMQ